MGDAGHLFEDRADLLRIGVFCGPAKDAPVLALDGAGELAKRPADIARQGVLEVLSVLALDTDFAVVDDDAVDHGVSFTGTFR